MPRVIIGSPLFNHAKDFREAIESILGQTFTTSPSCSSTSNDETPQIAKNASRSTIEWLSGRALLSASWTPRAGRSSPRALPTR
jgi:hypothetical protein